MDKIKISNEYVRAVFDSDWGGHFLALQFNHSDLGWVDIFMTEIEPTKSSQNTPFFSCLTMVPFANRIRDGVVVGADDRFQFPINLPEDGPAIHGTGVANNWSVVKHTDTSVVLKYMCANDQNHYQFEAQLLTSINNKTLDVELRLRNLSAHALPMGLGFHSWFANIKQSEVRFDHPMHPDFNSPWSLFPSPDFGHLPTTFKPSEFYGLDANFEDWNGRVGVQLGAISTQLDMTVKGALSEIHMFVEDENDRFCLEPVSHKPGRLNEKLACVEAHKQISGTMTLAMEKIK
jgi:aldose 1-epimerase